MFSAIKTKSVAGGLDAGLKLLNRTSREVSPRGLLTKEFPGPVLTQYDNPDRSLVIQDLRRDINPFFTVFEALWILAGRNDVFLLEKFLPRIKDYSDNGTTYHGAYGHRLRRHFGIDQLEGCARILVDDPDSRKAVACIWDPILDLGYSGKDLPCNDLITFKVREGKLYMTVFCRSNDIVWGCYGTNAVQFSFIMQWMAARLRVPVGEYYHISDSFHIYLDPEHPGTSLSKTLLEGGDISPGPIPSTSMPVVKDAQTFDREVKAFLNSPNSMDGDGILEYGEPFLYMVAWPLFKLWGWHQEWKEAGGIKAPISYSLVKFGDWVNTEGGGDLDNEWLVRAMDWIIVRETPAP